MAEREEDLKSLLMRVKECEKAGLKLNILKTSIMASGLITSQQREGEKVETETNFIFLGSKFTVDGDYSHEIKKLKDTCSLKGLPGGAVIKNLPTMRETRVQALSREDPLEKRMATHSSILPWRISWTEEPGRLKSIGSQKAGHD